MRVISIILLTVLFSCSETQPNPGESSKQVDVKPTKVVKPSHHNIAYLTGKFEPKKHEDFVAIPKQYADREGMFMRKDAFESFQQMYEAAKKDGIDLQIRSAARNFNYQKGIWENKWTGNRILSDGTKASDIENQVDRALKILEYSSMPGSSRHHWGTDIDLNSFDNSWFEKGEGLVLYNWLQRNAAKYGYCQVYCEKGSHREDGYNEEKWHYSFMPQSTGLLDYAKDHLETKHIHGFLGDQTAGEVQIISKYVLGIDHRCK